MTLLKDKDNWKIDCLRIDHERIRLEDYRIISLLLSRLRKVLDYLKSHTNPRLQTLQIQDQDSVNDL